MKSGDSEVSKLQRERRELELALLENEKLAGVGRTICKAIAEESTLEELAQKCVAGFGQALGDAVVFIWTLEVDRNLLELQACTEDVDTVGESLKEIVVGLTEIGQIAENAESYVSNAAVGDLRILNQPWLQDRDFVSFAGYPLQVEGRVIGVLAVYAGEAFSKVQTDTVESAARGIASGIERIRASDRARESELRSSLVGQAANDTIWDWNMELNTVAWSEGVGIMFGYQPEEVSTELDWWLGRVHEDDRAEVSKGIELTIAHREEYWRQEYRFRRADGSYADVWDRGRIIYDFDGKAVRMVGSMQDNTESKRMERRKEFLAEVAKVTEALVDPDSVVSETARLLAVHLDVNRCAYAEVEDKSVFVINGDYSRSVSSIKGRWPMASFGEVCVQQMLANEPFVVNDVRHDKRIRKEDWHSYDKAEIRAVICIPLHKSGQLTAAMAVHQKEARFWSVEEISLVRQVVGSCWESMERAFTARKLRESEERVRMAVEAADIGTWDLDLETDQLNWSPRCKQIFGLQPEEPIDYARFLELIHPEDRQRTDDAVQAAFESGGDGGYLIDYRVVRPDGLQRWIVASGAAQFVTDGNERRAYRFVGTVLDITERKESEEALKQSEEFIRSILESTPDCVNILDLEGRLQMMNVPGLEHMAIEDFESVRGREWCLLWPENSRDRIRRAISNASRGETDRFQECSPAGEGEERWWDIVLAPVSNGTENTKRIIAVTRDITVQKQAEEKLRDVANRLSEADRRKDEFLATLAHELRNPLAPIRTGLELMQIAKDDTALVAEIRDTLERQTLQLIALVDDLLDVSRITQGKLKLRISRVPVTEIINSAVEASRPFIEEAKHSLVTSLPEMPVYLDADPHRVAQVVSNLLNNSAKYTPDGGKLELVVLEKNGEVEIRVKDSGIGIPFDMLERIFEMFAQVERSIESTYTGLGIGLTLVKSLVEMHGGRVEVSSEGEGKGCEFRVVLPAAKTESLDSSVDSTVNSSVSAPYGLRVLVVDDNEAGAKMLAKMIGVLGNEVQTAHDGLEAVELAQAFRPEVILMDIGMPRMNGYEAAKAIRENSWGESILLVALTGWGQEEDRKKSAQAGFEHHLVKPADPAELEKLLASVARSNNA